MAESEAISSEDFSALCLDESPLQSLEESLRISLDKIKGNLIGPSTSYKSVCLSEYWNKLGLSVQALSKESTKLSVVFCKPPLPSKKETQALVDGVELVVIAVLSTYSTFNIKEGVCLHNVVKTFILDLLKAMMDFVSSITTGNKENILKLVGIVWEYCESFGSIPKDAKEMVLQGAKSSFGLINDAITEAEEYCCDCNECESNHLKDVGIDNSEKTCHMMHSTIGLAKVVKTLIKKIMKAISKNAQADEITKVNELDMLAQTIQLVSPSVDDLLCCLYSSSLTDTSILTDGMALSSLVEKLLQLCRDSHFCHEEDNSWLDFLSEALNHNVKKMKSNENGQQT